MSEVHIVQHPLVQHKLTYCRQKKTVSKEFRNIVEELSFLMIYEITRKLPMMETEIETPICKAKSLVLAGKRPAFVAILRAGLGMLVAAQRMVPMAGFGHIGMYREKDTLQPVEYLCSLPSGLDKRKVILLDPMIATGGSAVAALRLLKAKGATDITMVGLIGAPQGVTAIHQEFPEVEIYLAALDKGLDADALITPGMGDAGDRLYDT